MGKGGGGEGAGNGCCLTLQEKKERKKDFFLFHLNFSSVVQGGMKRSRCQECTYPPPATRSSHEETKIEKWSSGG